jgi:hypothetical protein
MQATDAPRAIIAIDETKVLAVLAQTTKRSHGPARDHPCLLRRLGEFGAVAVAGDGVAGVG